MNNNTGIKYTSVLPDEYITELRELAAKKIIPSVSYGIKVAVGKYLEQEKKERYKKYMQEASQDKAFLERTLNAQKDFSFADCEGIGEW
ncbi:MAG: hypothetical protein FWH10_02110 [Oscillospiraceae bacterium]|nr:hypothetical protein [Oscillospiraceae bacterium]